MFKNIVKFCFLSFDDLPWSQRYQCESNFVYHPYYWMKNKNIADLENLERTCGNYVDEIMKTY